MKARSVLMGIALGVLIGASVSFWQERGSRKPQNEIMPSIAQELHPPTAESLDPTPAKTPAQTYNVADERSQSLASDGISASLSEMEEVRSATLGQLQTPEGQAQLSSYTRRSLESSYFDIDQALGLTTAEKNELLDLLAMQRVRGMTTLVPEHESTLDSEVRQRRRYETDASELQALLGNKYFDWQDYKETLPVRQQALSLRLRLDAAGIPLTQNQERALINALSLEQRSINQDAQSDSLGRSARYTPESRQRLLLAATYYLSVEQLNEYEGVLERKADQEPTTIGSIERGLQAGISGGSIER